MFNQNREDNNLQQQAAEAAASAIVVTDSHGIILWANSAFTVMTGYSLEEIVGKNPRDLLRSGLHDEKFYAELWKTILAGKVWRGEISNRRRDQSIYRELQSIAPIFDQQGRISHFVSVREDITEHKRLEESVLNLRLEHAKTDFLRNFIQNTSHEFRTPLSIIQTQLYLMAKLRENTEQSAYEAQIYQQVGRINSLVDRLLLMMRLDNGIELNLQAIDLNQFLRFLLAGMDSKQVNFSAQFADSPIPILADVHALKELLEQILDNAFTFTPIAGEIRVSTSIESSAARICIHNTGSYIPPAEIPLIFERFYRHDTAHSTQGFGLGLPIAQAIAAAHNGNISVESNLISGTSFIVHLPLYTA